jgi:hypothetical protein
VRDLGKRIARLIWRFVQFMFSPFIVAIVAYGIGAEHGYHRGSDAMKDAIFGVLDKMAAVPEPSSTHRGQAGEGE